MPDSIPGAIYVCAALLVICAVTVALRAAPFAALAMLRGSALVRFLGETMPAGVMVILVMYTLRKTGSASWLPALLGLVATVVLHVWRGRAALSVVVGTAVFMGVSAWLGLTEG